MSEEGFTPLLYEIFSDLPRCGPGRDQDTQKAWNMIPPFAHPPRILDMGCGPGKQALTLARISGGTVTAVDNHADYPAQLKHAAAEQSLQDHVLPVVSDMKTPAVPEASFDVIWSEGAVYIMGVTHALTTWRRYLKPGGYVAFTDAVLLKPDAPQEVMDFWKAEYPDFGDTQTLLERVRDAGYAPFEPFHLPPEAWLDDYYLPLESRLVALKTKYAQDAEALEVIQSVQSEIDLFKAYSDYYGYVFVVCKAVEYA